MNSIADHAAFRAVFAEPGEHLTLILAEPGQHLELLRAMKAAGPRTLIYGGSSAALLPGEPVDAEFLETWARPILPALVRTADTIVPLARDSKGLLDELSATDDAMPIRSPRRSGDCVRYVLRNDWGIGDELLMSAVAKELVRAHPGIELWIRSRFGFRFPAYVRRDPAPSDARAVETIYQNASLYGPGAHSPFPGHLVQQMLDKFALDTGLKTRAQDVRPELEIRASGKRRNNSVILHSRPNPRLPSKDWGLPRWRELTKILITAGVHVRQVGSREEPLLDGVEDLRGTPAADLAEVFAESSAVVCVVGFLMHLAEATRTAAIVIYGGREYPAIDGYPDQVHLSSEPLPCRGRWGCHLAPDLECPNGMKCMERLTPQLVAQEVFRTLSRRAD